ncbi:hypothetical protein IJ556_04725 [bacterium]|nr:hypothetical protein [bacterium]
MTNKDFLKPIQKAMEFAQSDLPMEEFMQSNYFKEIVNDLKEIERQGEKDRFMEFVSLVLAD